MSGRALLLAIILIPLNSLWMMTASLWNAGYPTTVSLFFNAVFYLFALALINEALKRLCPRAALSTADLALIYIMLTVASAVNGLDMLQLIGAMIAGPHLLATPENEWRELFLGYIPSWLVVSEGSVLERYASGGSSLYSMENALPWVAPVLAWSAFTVSLLLVMAGLTLFLSPRWVWGERLSYPIIQLPLRLVRGGFLGEGRMWLGFAVGALMGAVNGLHFFFPSVPTIGRPINIGRFLTERPLSAVGWLPVAVHPFALGLAFFMPVDLSFSCWFFYFFWKFERVAAAALGLRAPGFPFIDEQTTGAYIGFALLTLWMARGEVIKGFKPGSPLTRLALASTLVGSIGIASFCLSAGMSLPMIAAFFSIYFLISISIGRIRAELGSPVHDLHFSGPGRMIVSIAGTRRLRPADLTIASLFWYFNRAYRSHPMPCVLEGVKLGERTGVSAVRAAAYAIFAGVFGTLSGFWAHLHAAYRHGGWGKLWPAYEAFNRLSYWLTTPFGGDIHHISAYAAGALAVLLLSAVRMRFIWFPLHPVGFVVSSSWAMNPFWFSIFLSWAVKSAVLRYGGLRAYRGLAPFFLGLILGEFTADSFTSLAGTILRVPTYIWYG
ncbi:hypothetical protein DRP77_07630 [Candidatus Poribacteria bacterium]|nr:MAG: hypothetical protein DRP77_07630 [Candidatus Poribacteria bacterium]